MRVRILLLLLALLSTSRTVYCDEPSKRHFDELTRLQEAMKLSSFPTPVKDRIQLWMQESQTSGRRRTADVNEWPVSATVIFFHANASRNDLKNIAIISDNGKSVRFIDPKKENLAVTRGDVVAILLAANAK